MHLRMYLILITYKYVYMHLYVHTLSTYTGILYKFFIIKKIKPFLYILLVDPTEQSGQYGLYGQREEHDNIHNEKQFNPKEEEQAQADDREL